MCAEGDVNTHLTGSSRLLNSESQFAARGGLGEAASWVVLRQDLYVCLTKSLPLRINLDSYRNSQAFVDTSDHSIANRAVYVCGRVVRYAMDPNSHLDADEWEALDREAKQWHQATPWRFLSSDSTAIGNESDSAFPTLWMPRRVQGRFLQWGWISDGLTRRQFSVISITILRGSSSTSSTQSCGSRASRPFVIEPLRRYVTRCCLRACRGQAK